MLHYENAENDYGKSTKRKYIYIYKSHSFIHKVFVATTLLQSADWDVLGIPVNSTDVVKVLAVSINLLKCINKYMYK